MNEASNPCRFALFGDGSGAHDVNAAELFGVAIAKRHETREVKHAVDTLDRLAYHRGFENIALYPANPVGRVTCGRGGVATERDDVVTELVEPGDEVHSEEAAGPCDEERGHGFREVVRIDAKGHSTRGALQKNA
jgi:hypothetical protein